MKQKGVNFYYLKNRVFQLMAIHLLFTIFLSLCTTLTVNAESLNQGKVLHGTVKGTDGMPLPGVNVTINGTTKGVITDTEGFYSINVAESNAILSFSFIGYTTQEIAIEGKTTINVILAEKTIGIDEVVAIGYGTMKKVNLTGSVESVNKDLIANRAGTTISNVLTGQVSGLTITQASGQPGKDAGVMHIRGIGTIRGSDEATAPLVIIDGIESSFQNIAVEDIENISVLKDAASAAIYGVRAANGVVLITTKRGIKGKTRISYNVYGGFQQTTKLPQFLGSADYATLYNEALKNDGSQAAYTPQDIEKYRSQSDPDNYPNSDWLGELFVDRAFQQNHHLEMSGGNDKTAFSISLNYLQKNGLIPNTNYDRYILRSNFDHQINDKFKIGLNLSLSYDKTIEPAGNGAYLLEGTWLALNYAFKELPTTPIKYSNGNWGANLNESNSVAMARDGGTNSSINYTVLGTLFGEYQLTKDLSVKGVASATTRNEGYDVFLKNLNLYNGGSIGKTFRSQLNAQRERSIELDLSTYLNYEKKWVNHYFKGLLGFNTRNINSDYIGGSVFDLPENNNLDQLDAGKIDTQRSWGNKIEYRLVSLFGRLNYSFKDRYLAEANFRYDGTSRFPSNKRFAFFPSFSLGWRISEEDFLKNSATISNLKLRASWGQLGNQDIGNYPYQNTYAFGSVYSLGSSVYSGITESTTLANKNITWEVSDISNIGLDIGIFDEKLTLTTEFFIKNTNDILLTLPLPKILGANPPYQNAGKVQNKGIELGLKYRGQFINFNYYVNGNFSYVHNEILDLRGTDTPGRSVGDPIYNIFGYLTDGLFQNQAEIDAGPDYSAIGKPLPGDIKYVDLSGDGKVDSKDRTSLGSYYPKYDFGILAGFNYNNFDFSMTLQGVAGVKRELRETSVLALYNGGKLLDIHLDRWNLENTNASYPRLSFKTNSRYNSNPSSFFVNDASFLRCRNIQLGYTIPKRIIKSLDKFRFYVSVDNAFTITKFKIFDPEIPNKSGIIYPQVRTFIAGLNINF